MAGIVVKGNNEYIGLYKLASGVGDMVNGKFVTLSVANGVASTPTANSEYGYFVENVIDTVDEDLVDDVDFTITAGKYLRLKKLLPGEIFVTDQTAAVHAVGAIVDMGATGTLTATSGSPKQTFQVIEKPTMWGKTVYQCLVLN